MPVDLSPLATHHDLLFEVPLNVRQGHRFQPTGFPDLGAAEFDTPGGRSLLVESAQSMANRLEAVCWDESANDLIEPLRGLSYVRVVGSDETFLTSSILEAHRLNSAYIEKSKTKDETFSEVIQNDIGTAKNKPIDRVKFVKTLFKYDVGSLVHGVFLESIDGRLRVARALSAFVEADGVKVAASGGVKNDRVQPGKDEDTGKSAKEGFGNLPFPRDEYTAEKITLYASLDLAQIRGYRLDEDATKLLILLSLFKLRAFVESPMRLRTACSFERKDKSASGSKNVTGFELPPLADVTSDLKELIKKTTNAEAFAGEKGITIAKFATQAN